MNTEYEKLQPIMQKYQVSISPVAFQDAVNRAYHAAEAKSYHQQHQDHWLELQLVWQYSLAQAKQTLPKEKWSVLDIGCGTGLVGDYLATHCSQEIATLVCLDPSPEMLAKCEDNSKKWNFQMEIKQGMIEGVKGQFDLITINSVLHHIVDTGGFLKEIEKRLKPGGLLITAQDGVAGNNSQERAKQRRKNSQKISLFTKLSNKIAWKIKKMRGVKKKERPSIQVIVNTNNTLMEASVIDKAMDAVDVWAVTDFHVPSKWGIGTGFESATLQALFASTSLVAWRTYHFYGMPWDQLTPQQRKMEMHWWQNNDADGILFSSIWKKAA